MLNCSLELGLKNFVQVLPLCQNLHIKAGRRLVGLFLQIKSQILCNWTVNFNQMAFTFENHTKNYLLKFTIFCWELKIKSEPETGIFWSNLIGQFLFTNKLNISHIYITTFLWKARHSAKPKDRRTLVFVFWSSVFLSLVMTYFKAQLLKHEDQSPETK